IVASKGRFDRAVPKAQRQKRGLPWESDMLAEDFMADTLDLWEIPPESARRVSHPAPFPVELPARLIPLYTYRNDLVLDPFNGSGSTRLAAARLGRRYVGYDLAPAYRKIAETRVREEAVPESLPGSPILIKQRDPAEFEDNFQARATSEGRAAQAFAHELLQHA